MKQRALQPLSKKHYSNIIVISKNGNPLSTISEKRANWYLKKNLAVEVPAPTPYPKAIKINFDHNCETNPRQFDLLIVNDQCAICGKTEDLTLHHIIPYVLRKHFPSESKCYSREWCVLLCVDCHGIAELKTQPLYKRKFPAGIKNRNTNIILQEIKDSGNIHKVKAERLKWLLEKSDYKSIEEIPPLSVSRKEKHEYVSKMHKEAISKWAKDFIDKHDGIKGVKKYFGNIFLSLNPKFLPDEHIKEFS